MAPPTSAAGRVRGRMPRLERMGHTAYDDMMAGVALAVAYLLGAIPFALLLARRVAGTDVRHTGSGNIGAANVLRTTRPAIGVSVLALDIGKGAAAVTLAAWIGGGEGVSAAAAAVAVVGHLFPVCLGFRGGKGVATAGGAFAVLSPVPTTIAVALFAAVVAITRHVSLGSIIAAVMLPPLVFFLGGAAATVNAALVAAALIVFRQRPNVSRLLSGTERRFTLRGAARRQRAT